MTEGDAGTAPATFTVNLSHASGKMVTVHYLAASATATVGTDVESADGTLTFDPGQTSKTISIGVFGDTIDEADETFSVTLSAPTNATLADDQATGTITDNDPPPALSIADATVTEGDAGTAPATFTVNLSHASGKVVTVHYLAAGATATVGSDVESADGTLTFDPGQTSKTISIGVFGDTIDEADETFSVTLSAPTNATLAKDHATGTITDDDLPPAVSLARVSTVSDRHKKVTRILIGLTATVDPVQATNIANYHLTMSGRHGSFDARKGAKMLKVRSATYDAGSHSVTLSLAKPLKITKAVQLRIGGPSPSGLKDAFGRPINAVAVIGKRGTVFG